MNYDWQIAIQWEMAMIGYGLYIFRKNSDGTVDYKTAEGDVRVRQGERADKYLYMCLFEDTAQLTQLIEQAEKQGVQAPSTATALGKLEATERHLQDLRLLIPGLTPTTLTTNTGGQE